MHAIGRSNDYPLFMRSAVYTSASDDFFFDENTYMVIQKDGLN